MTFQDIQNRIYFLTHTNVNSFTKADMNLAVNRALERVVSLINRYDRRWQFDDSNLSDLPVATTTLTANQQDYSLATSHLTIDRVEVKDEDGDWHLLTPIDPRDIKYAMAEYQKTAGDPIEYDKIGNSIFLYPKPDYTQAASLKVYFTRAPLGFDYSDDKFTDDTGSAASEPGFNSLFHDLIPLWASYDYSMANSLQSANQLFIEIQRKEKELVDFYGRRSRDEKNIMTLKKITYI